jgi:hypothetical protein
VLLGGLRGRTHGWCGGLEYGSTSGLYSYNGVRRIAEKAGYELAQKVLADHVERLAARERGERRRISLGFKYEVPASVVAECYGAARLAA